jgi:questin oxidase-like protein
MMLPDYSQLDPNLERLRHTGALLSNGFVNHMPMVVESLISMGRGNDAQDWIATHLAETLPEQAAATPLDPQTWQSAIGDFSREAEWRGFFEAELATADWKEVLDRWADRLAPGLFASATHGLIRVGHAARSMNLADTDLRRRELAQGLALWASDYQALPTKLADSQGTLSPARALDRVPLLPEEQRRNQGAITTAIEQLDGLAEFAPVIGLISTKGVALPLAHDVAKVFAQVFLDQVNTPLSAIVLTHSLTAVAAIINVAPHVSNETLRRLLAYGWQAACGLYSAYAQTPSPCTGASDVETIDEISLLAVENGDDHVIKLSETCIGFHQATGDERFLMLPAHARSFLTVGVPA